MGGTPALPHAQVQAFSRQGWCGPCGKREVVSGLAFVRCGRCKAEMLEATYQAHLKQNVAVTDEHGRRVTGRCADAGKEVRAALPGGLLFTRRHPRRDSASVRVDLCAWFCHIRARGCAARAAATSGCLPAAAHVVLRAGLGR